MLREVSADTLVSTAGNLSTELADNTSGGAYDTVPEVCILLALFHHSSEFYPVVFDEAGEWICYER